LGFDVEEDLREKERILIIRQQQQQQLQQQLMPQQLAQLQAAAPPVIGGRPFFVRIRRSTSLRSLTFPQVNKKQYARLDLLGKGGSSRVYRVLNTTNEIYAIKRVTLEKADDATIHGYMNEIALLKRLEGNQRIIRLVDSEVKGGEKGHLMLVMECGEIGGLVLVPWMMQVLISQS
jgi:serine/threonine-protein kinase TTK/MPS1